MSPGYAPIPGAVPTGEPEEAADGSIPPADLLREIRTG